MWEVRVQTCRRQGWNTVVIKTFATELEAAKFCQSFIVHFGMEVTAPNGDTEYYE